jgi:macrodomain Ter protein organizer (MatP/YcbG family)
MAKNKGNLIDFVMDPAVEAVIRGHEKNQEERSMPVAARRKLKRERVKAEKRRERKFGLDIDPDLKQRVINESEKQSCTASQLVQLAIQRLMDDVDSGAVNLRDYRVPADGPRYENRILRFPVDENSS